ncbi:MAG TPA: hypothetical protein VF941_09840 [Clostridia bacterium]
MIFDISKDIKSLLTVCGIFIFGLVLFDIFSLMEVGIFICLYLLIAVPFFLVLIIVSLFELIKNYKNVSLRSFLPLIVIFTTLFISSVILCITPDSIVSHEAGLYLFSREFFSNTLPPDSEIILKGSEHGNGTGTSNHCENLAYIAISSDKSMDEIRSFYESRLSNKIDKDRFEVHLYNDKKNDYYPLIENYPVFSFAKEQTNQLEKAEEKKKAIYIVSVVKGCSTTCLKGH